MADVLTADEVRMFLTDYAADNLLLDAEDFTDGYINLCISLAVDSFNIMPPASVMTLTSFPSKALLLYGTLWHVFDGKAALSARNTLSYSDGGVTIPVEEKFELYSSLAASYQAKFSAAAMANKLNANMESGWGRVSGDQAGFPIW